MKVLLLTILMIFTGSAYAGLYKWVDNEGNVHYSQKRPLGKQYKRLKAPAAAPEDSKPLYSSSSKKSEDNVVSAEIDKNTKLRQTNCTRAKKHLNTYQVYSRIRGKDGVVRGIGAEERNREVTKAKQLISDFCD